MENALLKFHSSVPSMVKGSSSMALLKTHVGQRLDLDLPSAERKGREKGLRQLRPRSWFLAIQSLVNELSYRVLVLGLRHDCSRRGCSRCTSRFCSIGVGGCSIGSVDCR